MLRSPSLGQAKPPHWRLAMSTTGSKPDEPNTTRVTRTEPMAGASRTPLAVLGVESGDVVLWQPQNRGHTKS